MILLVQEWLWSGLASWKVNENVPTKCKSHEEMALFPEKSMNNYLVKELFEVTLFPEESMNMYLGQESFEMAFVYFKVNK